jgi:hypothetical protein
LNYRNPTQRTDETRLFAWVALLQRRRWINGTVAGYLWLLGEAGPIAKSSYEFVR